MLERSLIPDCFHSGNGQRQVLILVAVDALVPGTFSSSLVPSDGEGPHERRHHCLLLTTSQRCLILRPEILGQVVYHKPSHPPFLPPHSPPCHSLFVVTPHNSHVLIVSRRQEVLDFNKRNHKTARWRLLGKDFMVLVCVLAPAGL